MELKSTSQLSLISVTDDHKSKININRKVSKQTLQDVKRLEKLIIKNMTKQEVLDKLHVKLMEKQKLENELARKEHKVRIKKEKSPELKLLSRSQLQVADDAHHQYLSDTLGKVCEEVARLEDTLDKTDKSIIAELECLSSNACSEIDEIRHKLRVSFWNSY